MKEEWNEEKSEEREKGKSEEREEGGREEGRTEGKRERRKGTHCYDKDVQVDPLHPSTYFRPNLISVPLHPNQNNPHPACLSPATLPSHLRVVDALKPSQHCVWVHRRPVRPQATQGRRIVLPRTQHTAGGRVKNPQNLKNLKTSKP